MRLPQQQPRQKTRMADHSLCPFTRVRGRLKCRCGNYADDLEFGFQSGVVEAFVCTTDEDERVNFTMGGVAMNVCCKCSAVWPVGDTNAVSQMAAGYAAHSSSCATLH